MLALCRMILGAVADLFRPRAALEAEILVLRQQIIVLRRGKPGRLPVCTENLISSHPVLSENPIRDWIRVVMQNHRILTRDVCCPACHGYPDRQPI